MKKSKKVFIISHQHKLNGGTVFTIDGVYEDLKKAELDFEGYVENNKKVDYDLQEMDVL